MSYKKRNEPLIYAKNGVYEINAGEVISDSIYLGTNQLTLPIVDCSKGNAFKITVTTSNLWRAINVPKNCLYIFSLEIINGGSFTQTWFNNTKWNYGITPSLTSSGTDILAFLTDDGGLTWYGVVSAKDVKTQTLYKVDYAI
jgi:hypothetical protein